MSDNPHHLCSSAERYTPPDIIEAARRSMGSIDLDPASNAFVNERLVKADVFFDIEKNGLEQEWNYRNVFLNPPGDRRGLGPKRFWKKAIDEWIAGNCDNVIYIGFSLEQLRSLQNSGAHWQPINFTTCFPKTRLSFLKFDEEKDDFVVMNKPSHANFITLISRDSDVYLEFRSQFKDHGVVSYPSGILPLG